MEEDGDASMKQKAKTSPMGVVRVTFLGKFSLEANGTTLDDSLNRSLKLWSVLAYLILHQDRLVPQSEFIELFWPEENSSNPVNALKTLLYRIRVMLAPLFGPASHPILAHRGAYGWNPALPCVLDIDQFERLCHAAAAQGLAPDRRIMLYRQALSLYAGDLLPKLSGYMWITTLSARYHAIYLAAVKSLAGLLDDAQYYNEMHDICSRASDLDPLDEDLHALVIRALIHMGRDSAALSRYENATDLLYRNLGVRPSEALRSLYTELMSTEKSLETDLGVIMGDLREAARPKGAFVCEYGFFKEAYRLEARRAVRSGNSVHICLITVSLPDGDIPPLDVLSITMDQLLAALTGSLRQGDVVSRYSGAQYVVMLPGASYEDSNMVMDRAMDAFYRQHRRSFLKLNVRIRELDLV
ncbi:MAG: hypothetical protein LKK00_07075 [Intestinimonas sp.]|jgi:DNA-binding SARP family transcriptional activator|nr:hypothetical protein [Intestinimonas sp.]